VLYKFVKLPAEINSFVAVTFSGSTRILRGARQVELAYDQDEVSLIIMIQKIA